MLNFLRWASVRFLALSLLILLGALRIWDPTMVEALRLKAFDMFQNAQPRVNTEKPILIVDIDERSISEIGQWPWPRVILAQLIEALHGAGAKVVGFDIVFSEPDRMSPTNIADRFRMLPVETAKILRALPSNDALMAESMASAQVVLGRIALETPSVLPLDPTVPQPSIVILGPNPAKYLSKYRGSVENLPILARAAAGQGVFSMSPEFDNIVRRVPTVYMIDGKLRPSLAMETLRVGLGETSIAVRSDAAGISSIIVGNRRIPTDNNGRVWIHFARATSDRYISAADILTGQADLKRIRGKMVLIGTSAAGLRDLRATPLALSVPGVEMHAQILETVLSGSTLTRPNYAVGIELTLATLVGLLMIVLVPILGPRWTLLLGAAVTASLVGGAWYLFQAEKVLIDVAYPIVTAIAIYLFLTFTNYLKGEAERRRIRTAFSRYLSPDLVTQLAADSSALKLGGEEREMTLLFSDVHGFTGIAEHYNAVELTSLINDIFNPLTKAILDENGTVDKYMGDAIMAFWNAPVDDEDHARHACLACLEMGRRIPILNEELKAEAEAIGRGFTPVKLGIGLNTGECCVGNMGSDFRFDYSVIGDTVNAASRLEGQTRTYKVANVIGETTRELATGMAFLELDLVSVVGKTELLRIYTLLGNEEVGGSPDFVELKKNHDAMLSAYRAQDWDGAAASLGRCRDCLNGFALDTMYDMYQSRIDEFRENPPAPDWDAVYVATSKG